ncbi:hypothetical protein IMCC9480_663 [Oxalobacteraceae bacterium IMCC9480]|nr:hypothetical protein IMCC9480_663 [Oxalobacteraceae bacterium IMCC9480]
MSENTIFCASLPEAFASVAMTFPDKLMELGQIARFSTNGKPSNTSGWCKPFPDGVGAAFGCHREGTLFVWQCRDANAAPPSFKERQAALVRIKQVKKQAADELAAQYVRAASTGDRIWRESAALDPAHGYIALKGITPYLARQDCGGKVLLPIYGPDGAMQSLQFIDADRNIKKKFLYQSTTKGGRLFIGDPVNGARLIQVEGWATGCSIHQATGVTVAIGFSGSNLDDVAADLRRQFPDSPIQVAGDLDKHGKGLEYAIAGAAAGAGIVVMPVFADGRIQGDFNDLHQAEELDAIASLFEGFAPATEADTNVDLEICSVPAHLLTIPGRLGVMVDWTNETAVKPQPYFAVQAALAFGSVVLGRKYRTSQNNWPSLYFLNVGISASGKEHAKTVIEECLHASGLSRLIGACEYTSDSAVDSLLIDKPTHISILDEFGLILDAGNSKSSTNGATARRRLMEVFGRTNGTLQPKAFSTSGMTSRQRAERESRVIEYPALTLLAMTTPSTFYGAVGSGSMRDGFLNRFITVVSDVGRKPSRRASRTSPPNELTTWAKSRRIEGKGDIAEFAIDSCHDVRPEPTEVPFDPEADDLFDQFDRLCIDRHNRLDADGVGEMFGRVREIAMKVALVVSQSCESPTIKIEHARWAIDYVQYWAERSIQELISKVSDSPFAGLCNDVATLVAKAGRKGVTVPELSRQSAKFKGADERMRKLVYSNLSDDRGIVLTTIQSGSGRGKPRDALVDSKFLLQND